MRKSVIIKTLVRASIAAGLTAGAVHLIRKHDLVAKGAVLATDGAAKASAGVEKLVAKAVNVADGLLTQFDEKDKAASPADSTDRSEPPAGPRGNGSGLSGNWTPAEGRRSDAWHEATRKDGV